jgi:hypothetical protein
MSTTRLISLCALLLLGLTCSSQNAIKPGDNSIMLDVKLPLVSERAAHRPFRVLTPENELICSGITGEDGVIQFLAEDKYSTLPLFVAVKIENGRWYVYRVTVPHQLNCRHWVSVKAESSGYRYRSGKICRIHWGCPSF